jgi:hypothetical protein
MFSTGLLTLLLAPQIAETHIRDLHSSSWIAPNERALPPETPPFHKRTVGMFYFLANHVPNAPIYDVTKILQANPLNPAFGPFLTAHWWGEPWFGYYQSEDPWVIRKHMQMLANAGVDVILFDNTNGPTYPDVYIPLCQVLETMKKEGVNGPKIAFFAGHGAWNTLDSALYSKGRFRDLWFQWKGKPLMMVHLEGADKLPDSIRTQFSIRESWAWTPSVWFGTGHDKWPWLDNYPQNYGWHESPQVPEEVSVTVGQHASSSIGRSSSAQHEPPVNDQSLTPVTPNGVCFSQQFERALKIDPEFIFVTGWNEWTATRFKLDHPQLMAGRAQPAGGSLFVDEYNAEFSRDIEPAQGVLQDDYYYMLVNFVRRYKGAEAVKTASFKTIDIAGTFDQWKSLGPEYRDAVGDIERRDHPGWGAEHYVNTTGRNDIVAAKVACDAKNVYFYVQSKAPLTSSTDPNWMLLFLSFPGSKSSSWLGYRYVVDRQPKQGTTSIEVNVGGYRWKKVVEIPLRVQGNKLMLSIPRSLLGLTGGRRTLDFKWADNISQTGAASDFTLHGDSAPDDRFNYRATLPR